MRYFLGVELKGNQLKVAAFKKNRKVYELVKLDVFGLPNDLNEATKQLTAWTSRFLPEHTSIRAVLTVSESALYIKEMEFPEMEEKKLNEAVYWEIPSIAPIPQSDAVYDWQIVSDKKGALKVLVIVGKHSYIQSIIQTFRNAQIDIVAVEPSSCAFARVANAPFDTNTLLCLVEEQGMDFIILKKGLPFFTTSITGHSQSEKVSLIKSGTHLTEEVKAEGKKIIDYWEKKESLKIFQVVVSGDLAYKYLGLSTALNLFPPTPTYVGTIKNLGSLKTQGHEQVELAGHMVSIGAAVRHMQKDVLEGINLFPAVEKKQTEKIQNQKKATDRMMMFLSVNIIMIIILAVSIVGFSLWNYSLEKQLAELKVAFSYHPASTLTNEVEATNKVMEDVIYLIKNQDDTGKKLRTISDMTPQSIKLTSVNLNNAKSREWTVEGTGDRDSILAFYERLSQSVDDAEISMPYSNFSKRDGNEFSINLIW